MKTTLYELGTPVLIELPGLGAIPLPILCKPIWTHAMGARMMRARKWKCDRVDRRTPDWRHKVSYWGGKECACISQRDAAKQLGVSQSGVSHLETGNWAQTDVNIPSLLSVFSEGELLYILANVDREKYEGKRVKRRKKHG